MPRMVQWLKIEFNLINCIIFMSIMLHNINNIMQNTIMWLNTLNIKGSQFGNHPVNQWLKKRRRR
jgi:hypothetical protein